MINIEKDRRVRLAMAALIAVAFTAAGCADTPEGERLEHATDRVLTVPSRVYPPERTAIAVREAQIRAAVHFRPGAAALTPDDRTTLSAFVARSGAGHGDTAIVAVAGGPLAARRVAAIASVLQRHQLAVQRSFAGDPAAPHTAVVTLTRVVAVAPDCPDWQIMMRTMATDPFRPHFGCLHASALAASVHRPQDLVGGRALGSASGVVMDRGVQEMRGGKFDIPVTHVGVGTAKK